MKNRVPDVLVASARITTPGQFLRNRRVDPLADAEAWKWYDRIGEVHFGISSGAREASRATLKVVRWMDPDTPSSDEVGVDYFNDLVHAVVSPNGGQAQIINSFYANRKVAGDGYFAGYPSSEDPDFLWFDFLSPDELQLDQPSNQVVRRRTPLSMAGVQVEEDKYNLDDLILSRIWTPHPRYTGIADSGLKALHTVCEELDILTQSLKAKITSRLATAGFLLFPASVANSTPVPPVEGDVERFSENPFIDYVIRTMTQAILNPSAPSAAVPFVFVVPDQSVELIKWIREEAQTFEVDIRQRGELLGRILHGLDLRPEQIEGFSQSNHWSAWSTQDVHIKIDVAPDIEALCWAMTKDYLWPQARAAAIAGDLDSRKKWDEAEIRRWTVWYDLDNLTVRPNKADSYLELSDRITISRKSLREASGASETDVPTPEEYVQMLGVSAKNPYLATFGMPIQSKIDWEKVVAVSGKSPGPAPGGAQPEQAPSGPGKSAPGPKPSQSDRPRAKQPQ